MMLTSRINFLSLTMSSIMIHIMLVNAGVRPVASVMVRNEHIEEIKKLIKTENLFMVLNPRGENHATIYIFKHSYVENVINFTLGKPHDRKALMRWIEGKMFGYSDEEIAKYVTETCNLLITKEKKLSLYT